MKREKEDKKGAKHECWKTDGRETKCKKKLNEANSNDMKTESEKRERERESSWYVKEFARVERMKMIEYGCKRWSSILLVKTNNAKVNILTNFGVDL